MMTHDINRLLSDDRNINVIEGADLGLFRRGDFENPTRTNARILCICELGLGHN